MDGDSIQFLSGLESAEQFRSLATFRNNNGNTLLHTFTEQGMLGRVDLLLQDDLWRDLVNEQNKFGDTALHRLCQNAKTLFHRFGWDIPRRLLQALLNADADINIPNDNGWTPLHESIHTEYIPMVSLVLTMSKADVNKRTVSQGATPLHMAVDRALVSVTKLLIAKGASLELTTHDGVSILHWALSNAKSVTSGGDNRVNVNDEVTANYEVPTYGIDYGGEGNDENANGRTQNGGQGGGVVNHNADDEDNADDETKMNVILHFLVRQHPKDKWFQLLQVAYRESEWALVEFAFRTLNPVASKSQLRGVRRLWLAMREERFGDLEKELRAEVTWINNQRETKVCCESWNALELSTYLGVTQLVRWLLRSKHWTKLEKEKAMSRLRDDTNSMGQHNELGGSASIWGEPFAKYSGTGRKRYSYPSSRPINGDLSNKFQSSVLDVYSDGNRFGVLCHSSTVRELLYNEPDTKGPTPTMKAKVETLHQIPGFDDSIYNTSSFRFRWIHLPANCMQWMMDAATITFREKQKIEDEITRRFKFLENSWHELPENESEGKYMHPDCSRSDFLMGGKRQKTDKRDEATGQLALYVPYIKCAPVPQIGKDILDKHESSQDLKLPFHKSQTLDTYSFGSSDGAEQRDRDQVLSRYFDQQKPPQTAKVLRTETKTQAEEPEKADHESSEILHVGQLWLWVVDDKTIITGTSHHPEAGIDLIFEKILNRLSDSDESFNRDAVVASIDSFVKFIFSFYVNIVDNLTVNKGCANSHDDSHRNVERVSVDTVFRSSIEQVDKSENDLRGQFQKLIAPTSSRLPTEGEHEIHEAVATATKALAEIKDIRGELNMIRTVVRTQKRVWDQLFNRSVGHGDDSDPKQNSDSWKSTDPNYVLERIQGLLEFAQETEKNVDSVLGLRMNHLNLYEAENSRKQGETLMVFTVVTVIFTPLSFLTSLFALNISVFPHSGDIILYQPGLVFGILFGTLFGFSLIVWVVVKISKYHVMQRLLNNSIKFFGKIKLSGWQSDGKNMPLAQDDPQKIQVHEQQPGNQNRLRRYIPGEWNGAFFQWLRDRFRAKEDPQGSV